MHRIRKIACMLLIFLSWLFAEVPALAESNLVYSISGHDINVRIEADGSLEIIESIKYTSFGGYNNVMLFIDKQEGETVDIKNVYMIKNGSYIECDQLSAGQWDANVFSGTYSVIEEDSAVRLKVYGAFSKRNGAIVVKYKVHDAIKRYGDVAEFRRTFVPKNWGSRVNNINILVSLPDYTDTTRIRPFLHGVLVGRKTVEGKNAISFNVPDTVPGEYVETRILFPENLVPYARVTDDRYHLYSILQEEEEYKDSSKEELLKARENAAKEAGRRAWAERMNQRARIIATFVSLGASLLAIFILYRIRKELHHLMKTPFPLDMRDLEKLSPAEVRRVVANGRGRGRSFLGSLLHMASLGYLKVAVAKKKDTGSLLIFQATDRDSFEGLTLAERYLLEWVNAFKNDEGWFEPSALLARAGTNEGALQLKKLCVTWEQRIVEDYGRKNVLATRLVFYRELGLLAGGLLFILGCIIPVALSIWAGYLMLPVGFTLFLYSLRIQKHTDYGVKQHRTWKELKRRLLKRAIALDNLPPWMTDGLALLGYSIVLGTEKQLGLVETALQKANDSLNKTLIEDEQEPLSRLIKNTLSVTDKALSWVQDIPTDDEPTKDRS